MLWARNPELRVSARSLLAKLPGQRNSSPWALSLTRLPVLSPSARADLLPGRLSYSARVLSKEAVPLSAVPGRKATMIEEKRARKQLLAQPLLPIALVTWLAQPPAHHLLPLHADLQQLPLRPRRGLSMMFATVPRLRLALTAETPMAVDRGGSRWIGNTCNNSRMASAEG
jgi:hypothetical protein